MNLNKEINLASCEKLIRKQWLNLRVTIILLRRKNCRQLIRLVFTQIPLLSLFGDAFYQVVFHSRYYDYVNRKATRAFKENIPVLTNDQQQIVSTIKNDGIAVLSIQNISSKENIFTKLVEDADELIRPNLSRETDKNEVRPPKIRGLGRNVKGKVIPDSFIAFFLSDEVLAIVNSYAEKFSRLHYIDAWYNIPATDDDFIYSTEQWHRDHEDIKIIKVFLYLIDVDDANGCFFYLSGTQAGGKFAHINPVNPPRGVGANEQDITEIVSADDAALKMCMGEEGTVIISDTSGFHKGGRTTGKIRKVLVAFYTSDASVDQHYYCLPESIDKSSLSSAAKYAFHLEDDL